MANYITAAGESLTLPEGFENYSVKDSNTNTEKIAKILNAQDNRLNEIEKNTDKILGPFVVTYKWKPSH